jgi:hypothetical protein
LESETARRLQRFKRAHADDVFTSLERTTAELVALAGLKPETATETPASAAA